MNDIRNVLSYNDVLLVPRNSELDHLSDADIRYDYSRCPIPFVSVPVINAPMDTVCSPKLIKMINDTYDMPTTIHRFFGSAEEQIAFFESCKLKNNIQHCFLAVGIVTKWKEWIDKLIDYKNKTQSPFGILIDVANGDTKATVDTIHYLKLFEVKFNIMAGNIATRSGFKRLQEAGANFIRTGVGGGSICSTRITTGFGMPTLTSVLDCAKVKDTAYLIADGGIETNGDLCKAMVAGADMVMAGKMFAATDLAGNDKFNKKYHKTVYEEDYYYCNYRGMASREAAAKLGSKKSNVSVEGVSGVIRYRGKTETILKELHGNLQSSVAYYAGCRNWSEFQKSVKFVQITTQGWEESKTRIIED